MGGFATIDRIASDANTLMLDVYKNGDWQMLIVELDNSLSTPVATFAPTPWRFTPFALSGDTVFFGERFAHGGEGQVVVIEAANNYVPVEVRRPVGERNPGDSLGKSIHRAGPNEVLAGTNNRAFWISKSAGTWQVEDTGIPKQITWALVPNEWSGGGNNRDIVMNGALQNLVYHGPSQTLVGVLPPAARVFKAQTNGAIVMANDKNLNTIQVYHADIPTPPGC